MSDSDKNAVFSSRNLENTSGETPGSWRVRTPLFCDLRFAA